MIWPTMKIRYRPLGIDGPINYFADVEEYEPGFAEGEDVWSGKWVVVRWDGDEWIEVLED